MSVPVPCARSAISDRGRISTGMGPWLIDESSRCVHLSALSPARCSSRYSLGQKRYRDGRSAGRRAAGPGRLGCVARRSLVGGQARLIFARQMSFTCVFTA